MTKDEIAMKLERLINREVKIASKIKYSSNHIEDFAGVSGKLLGYDVGEEYEDVLTMIEVVIISGKKMDNKSERIIWVDARDIQGITGKGGKEE